MKVAIIGAGNIAAKHAAVLGEMDVEIKTIVTVTLSKAKAFAKKFNIPEYTNDIEKALADDITCVHICTPPNTHFEIVKKLIESGKHIVCEKPFCLDVTEAKILTDMVSGTNLINAVGFNVRFHDVCDLARENIKSGEIGDVYLVHGSYLQEFNAFPAPTGWRYNEALAGKMRAVTEIGSHWLDLAQYITGLKIKSVMADFGKFNPSREIVDDMMKPIKDNNTKSELIQVESEDAAVITLRFENGALGSAVVSEVSHGRINKLSIEVTGECKTLWWDSENNNTISYGIKSGGVQSNVFPFGGGFNDTLREMFRSVYEDIDAGKPSTTPKYATFKDGQNIVNLCEAVYTSATNNSKWVGIDNG